MKRLKKARVTVKIFMHGSHSVVASATTTMTNDLPADNLGEVLTEAIQEAWREGHDPVNFDAVVTFS